MTTTQNTVIVDEETYNLITENSTTYTLPTGQVTVSVSKNAVSIYDYESSLNESKRTISILNSKYVDDIETQFLKLMGS